MIKTSRQLKDKIKNLTHGDSLKSQTLLRTYMMERFLERLAVSQYNSHFVLKGGMLVSSMVGIHQRATMDIDATVVALPLALEDATRTIQEIVNIDLQDGVVFSITNAESIMEEHDYPGLRFTLIGTLDGLRQKVKIDISTGDAITPQAIEYRYPLMFENRSLQIMSYNLETLLCRENWENHHVPWHKQYTDARFLRHLYANWETRHCNQRRDLVSCIPRNQQHTPHDWIYPAICSHP